MNSINAELFLVDRQDHTPKYRQIINGIRRAVTAGQLPFGTPLPSINRLCRDYDISRDTAVKAYAELERGGVITARHGKGFFVAATPDDLRELRVLLLFDTVSLYKEDIYAGATAALPSTARIDLLFHHNRAEVATTLLRQYGHAYDCIGMIPPGRKCGTELLDAINALQQGGRRVFLLDWPADDLAAPGAFQDFRGSFATALTPHLDALRQYRRIHLLQQETNNHVAEDLKTGFAEFCAGQALPHGDGTDVPATGELYIVIEDRALAGLIKAGRERRLQPGRDYGLIAYNDTPLKEVIGNGLSVISTDFVELGRRFAALVTGQTTESHIVPARVIRRQSF